MLKKNISYIYLAVLLILPVVLILLPADFFDKGRSVCLSVLLFDQTCYGCGMTRAIQHLIHFDISAAASFNKISFIALPVVLFVWIEQIIRIYKKIKPA